MSKHGKTGGVGVVLTFVFWVCYFLGARGRGSGFIIVSLKRYKDGVEKLPPTLGIPSSLLMYGPWPGKHCGEMRLYIGEYNQRNVKM